MMFILLVQLEVVDVFYRLSKPSAPKAESSPPGRQGCQSVFGVFRISPPSRTKVIHAFGILGMIGPLHTVESGWITSEFAAWQFLISQMKGFKTERSIWLPIRPINHLFPDGSVIFGEAGCDRLRLPLPITPETHLDPEISASRFTARCLLSLDQMARKVKPGETLVLLLIGHGGVVHDGEFQFLVTTHPSNITGEAYITKGQLEEALKPCQGDILTICNSYYSGHLKSECWTLLCSATPDREADALSQSHSGHFRGSTFTACAVAQVAREHGLQVPLPRTDPEKERASLPLSLPPHSFSTPIAEFSLMKPSNISFTDFVDRMISMKEFVVENSINVFQVGGPKSTVSWTSVFPVHFTAEVMDRIGIKADSPDYVTNYNEVFPGQGLQGGHLPTPMSRSCQFSPLLTKLVFAMPDSIHALHTIAGVYTKAGEDLRRHIAEPERYPSPLEGGRIGEESLLIMLHSMNVQAVAVQYTARVLGWCDAADEVVAFVPQQITNWNLDEMLKNGIRVNELPWYLKEHHFPGYVHRYAVLQVFTGSFFFRLRPAMNRTSAQWLWTQWDAARRPEIPGSLWSEVMEKVGVMTKSKAIR